MKTPNSGTPAAGGMENSLVHVELSNVLATKPVIRALSE